MFPYTSKILLLLINYLITPEGDLRNTPDGFPKVTPEYKLQDNNFLTPDGFNKLTPDGFNKVAFRKR